MSKERAHEIATAYRQEAAKSMDAAVLFATILLFVHLLDLRPSSIEAMDVKIGLPNPAILRGALAVVFVHKLYSTVFAQYYSNAISRTHEDKWFTRTMLARSRKRGRSTAHVKTFARLRIAGWSLFVLPYGLVLIALIIATVYFAINDIYDLAIYTWGHGMSERIGNMI